MAIGKRFIFLAGFIVISLSGFAQGNRYMVFFKDKSGSTHDVRQANKFLSQKAIDRRIQQDLIITSQDFPVNQHYVQGVRSTGADVFFTTRWMNGLLIQCQQSLLPTIQALSFVDHIEFVAPGLKLNSNGRKATSLRKKSNHSGVETHAQLRMLGIPEMHADNYHGEGITIAVLDGGFPGVNQIEPFQHIISEGRIDAALSYDFISNTNNVFQYDDHGTEVLSVMAAYTPDLFTGGAYKANYQLYVTEDASSEYRIEEYNWLFAAERADSAGVDIIHSSLGYYDFDQSSMNYTTAQMDGKTAVVTKAAQWAADRGIVVVCSAGNEGNVPSWRIIAAPADAVDVIAVANVNLQGVASSSSSTGPSADGRIKPDLAALGTGVRVVRASGGVGSTSGTSLAAPLITSLVAGVWQHYSHLTRKQLVEVLKETASRANNPDNEVGYGIPNYKAVVNYIDRAIQSKTFEVFPNPAIDTVSIRPFDPEEITSCVVELISSQGQILSKDSVNFNWLNRSFQKDISHLSSGLYYLRVWTGQVRFVFKVVKV